MAVTTFVGQNIGAGNLDRAKKGTYQSLGIIAVLCVVLGALLYNYGILLMRAFTDNQNVLDMGFRGLRFLAFLYVLMGINQCVSGAIRGAGEANVPALLAILGNLIRIPFAYWLAIIPLNSDIAGAVASGAYATLELAKAAGVGIPENFMGLFYSMGITMVFGAVTVVLYFIFGNWQNKSVAHRLQ